MPHDRFGPCKVQIHRPGPCQRVGVGSKMNLRGTPAGNADDGRFPERKTVIEGVFLRDPSDQILVTAQQHPDRVFPLRAGKAALADQRTEDIAEAGVAVHGKGTELSASGKPDLNLPVLGCLVHGTPLSKSLAIVRLVGHHSMTLMKRNISSGPSCSSPF